MTRILLVDEHAIVRRGVREILARSLPDVYCAETENADRAIEALGRDRWDLVILDLMMRHGSGLEALKAIRAIAPSSPVLVLTMHPVEHFGRRALKAGAAGFLNKGSPPEELITAVQKILRGGRYLTPALAEVLAVDLARDPDRPAHALLSDREFEVLRLIGLGRTVAQIAAALHLSAATISTYRTRILEKLHLQTTAELIHYAVTNSLV